MGSDSIVVSPKACSIVTGNASASTSVVAVASLAASSAAVVEPVLQAVRAATARAAAAPRRRVRVMETPWLGMP